MPVISVIVPIYNEEHHLGGFIQKQLDGLIALNQPFEIILSENGSTDQTRIIARALQNTHSQIKLITSKTPNYGQAVRRGFLKAQGKYLVLFDLDYFDFLFLKKSLKLLSKYDGVVGSKTLKTSSDKRNFVRRIGSQSFSYILRLFFSYKLHDTHGIKVLNRKKFIPIIKKSRFTREIFDTELLIRAQNAGLNLTEIPVTVKEMRQSRSSIVRRTLKTLPDLFKLKLALTKQSLQTL